MERLKCFVMLCVLIYMASTLPAALSWGVEGHTAVCTVAEGLLNKEAADAVDQLLPDYAKGNLSSLCLWADKVKFKYPWSRQLHYINTPDFNCKYDYSRDCHDDEGVEDRCVAGAINNYTSQLTTFGTSNVEYNLTESLLFLAHLMADIHQPLHVGFTGDKGGNTIMVRWFKRKENLHHVWDSSIVETAQKDFYDSDFSLLVDGLQTNLTDIWSDEVPIWEKCSGNKVPCPNVYASESIDLACKWAYRNATAGTTLEDDYFLSRLPIVEEQIAKGGVRLAATLNRLFS